jgi:invasion protein IalB
MFDSLKFHRVLFACFALTFIAGTGLAQDSSKAPKKQPGKTSKFGNWAVVCPPAGDKSGARCVAQLSLIDSKRKIVLVAWRIGLDKSQKLLTDMVTPTDVLIAPGVSLLVGKGPVVKMPYVSCGLQGCLSRTFVNATMLDNLKNTTAATVVLAANNGKALKLKLDTTGVGDALRVVMEQ